MAMSQCWTWPLMYLSINPCIYVVFICVFNCVSFWASSPSKGKVVVCFAVCCVNLPPYLKAKVTQPPSEETQTWILFTAPTTICTSWMPGSREEMPVMLWSHCETHGWIFLKVGWHWVVTIDVSICLVTSITVFWCFRCHLWATRSLSLVTSTAWLRPPRAWEAARCQVHQERRPEFDNHVALKRSEETRASLTLMRYWEWFKLV